MAVKVCFKCGKKKKADEFYRHPMMADGRLNKCKSCARADVRANRLRRLEYYRAYDLLRSKNPKRIAAAAEVNRRWRAEDRRRTRAHNMVARAVACGRLVPQPCCVCGSAVNIHAHHDDYDRPLDVRWLCAEHHSKEHQKCKKST